MEIMAEDTQRRRLSEAVLNSHLRKAEEETLRDPEVRQMVERLRKMYLEDQEGIFTAFAVTTQEGGPVQPSRVPPPSSKIPDLLLMLSELAERAPARNVPIPPKPPKPLLRREPELPETTSPKTRAAPVSRAPEDDRQRELIREIEEAKKTLALIKKEERLIRARRGKYGIPGERLKAERLLRELPGQIVHMEHTLQLLREGVL